MTVHWRLTESVGRRRALDSPNEFHSKYVTIGSHDPTRADEPSAIFCADRFSSFLHPFVYNLFTLSLLIIFLTRREAEFPALFCLSLSLFLSFFLCLIFASWAFVKRFWQGFTKIEPENVSRMWIYESTVGLFVYRCLCFFYLIGDFSREKIQVFQECGPGLSPVNKARLFVSDSFNGRLFVYCWAWPVPLDLFLIANFVELFWHCEGRK